MKTYGNVLKKITENIQKHTKKSDRKHMKTYGSVGKNNRKHMKTYKKE